MLTLEFRRGVCDGRERCDVDFQELGAAAPRADFIDDGRASRDVARADDDVRSEFGDRTRGFEPDAVRGAGDENDLAVQNCLVLARVGAFGARIVGGR
jgi:hypothetical protein